MLKEITVLGVACTNCGHEWVVRSKVEGKKRFQCSKCNKSTAITSLSTTAYDSSSVVQQSATVPEQSGSVGE